MISIFAENPVIRKPTSEYLKPAAEINGVAVKDRVCWYGKDPTSHSQTLQGMSALICTRPGFR